MMTPLSVRNGSCRSGRPGAPRAWPIALAAALVAGCTLAPRYERPAAPVPASYARTDAAASRDAAASAADGGARGMPGARDAANASGAHEMHELHELQEVHDTHDTHDMRLDDWRAYFTDPSLRTLIDAALANNRDLRIATLRIQEARGLYGVARADRLPSIDGNLGYERTRQYDPVLRESATSTLYRAGVGVSAFEIDLFGRVKSLSDAALAEYFATAEGRRAAHISLIAEVASAYVAERALVDQLALAERTLAARDATYALTQRRYAAGTSTAIELRTAEMLVASARASKAALEREHTQATSALKLLAGDFTTTLPAGAPALDEFAVAPVSPGLPSDLLEQRPDIRQAEQRLVAANANIGAARAAFFPRITLTTDAGSVSDAFSGLFSAGSSVWTFAPRLTLPIFAGGRNRANLDVADARKDIAVADYEKTIQTAFREVADALAARDQIDAQLAAQQAAYGADTERLRLAQRRYGSGVASYLELLDAQRSTFESGQELIRLKQLRLTNAIALYRALGGGWSRAACGGGDICPQA
ncbi:MULTISPECIES: efflux transporter outer membrane subunit [Burkholderia]|uniref:efflux transporter outer membrane subunit n=1 Tax=Burkholderia TaxID=32008 RepID=UPI00075E52B3|nr:MULTISPECIES: efflux transporter outer membrane subunit [Burkholderia]AOJ70818.1 multidrug transporter [Burkholderia savannae]KVG37961.1 multidrug transporter [Burkholderia sp. MSMB0265]KVG78285.1 multidrug transporter [Burkholderia sp. MSMB2040]KVG97575.1 multidrug transporter [Burkholderia sp. MSMB2041]KVH01464.1 multidrug transporter [Burkholderia sp. MSMB2042]